MSFFDQSRLNKVLKGVGRVKAKAEMALIGGGERISVGKTKAIAAKAAGDPGIANRVNVTYTGRGEKGIFPGLPGTNSGSHYNPATDTIQTAPNAAVAAHEGTHAAQARWISKTAERLGLPPEVAKQAPTAIFTAANMGAKGAAGAAATDKLGTGGRVTGAVLGHIPQLALEGHATIKGTLSQPGGVRTALGSFGSYATAAGANIRKAMKPRELSAREELESIILFRSQEGTEKDRYGNLKKAAIAAGVLGAAGGGIYAAKKIGRGVGRLAKGGEDVLKRVSGVLGEVHHNATDIGQYAHAAIPKAEAYVASTAPKVEAYVKDHIIPITEKAKGVVETMHKGLQPMRDYGAIYRAGREGAFFIPKLTSNPKKWWGNVKAGWNEGRHGAAPTMDPFYHDPEIAAKVQPHIDRWVKRIGKTKESIAKRAPEAGRPFATSAGPVMQWSARDELNQIINFDMASMVADKLGKVAWGKIGQGALKGAGIGALGGAAIGGAQGAANGDIVGGAASGAMSGGMLGAAGGAAHSAGAFKGLMGTEEQIAARAAKKAAAGNVAAPAAKVAAPATGQEGYRAAAQARMAGTDELKGSFSGNPAASNTSVADAIAANQAKTARAKGIADVYGVKGMQSGAPASATQAADSMASRQGALGNRSIPQQPAQGAMNNAQPQASGVQAGRRFKSADEAVRAPVNEDAWNKLDPNIQNRARGVANLHNDPGYQGDKTAAAARYHDMRERHGFSAREELNSIIQLAAWTRKEGKSRSGGLNEKGRKSYERENPGSDLKAPSKEAGNPRRASFCARMSGMKKKLTSSKTANDPDSRINKSLKAWNCSARHELNTIIQLDEESGERSSLEGLAICFRRMQLFAHNAHNLATGKTFMQDHGFLSELYAAYTDAYDDLVERMIGLGQSADLSSIQQQAAASIPTGSPFPTLLGMEKEVTAEIEEEIKEGCTQGTINLLAGLADASEVRQYKLGQILKGSAVKLSAREELEVIRFGSDWRDKTSDNAGAIATASGAVGGLSSYVRGGVQNAANWKSASQIKGALAGGAVAGLGGYAIAKLLKKDKPGQAQIAGRIGSGHQNSLSARDQLNTILMGVDPRPRNPLGEFSGAEEGQPNPQHMKIVYAAPQEQAPPAITGKNMGKLAAGGAAFMGGGMALQHLIEKLKSVRKK
jgi:DNA-binding ferritin-like protein